MTMPSIIAYDRAAETLPLPDLTDADVAEGSRAQRGIGWLHDTSLGLKSGIWEAGASISPWHNYAVDEFIFVLEGEIV
ncbi:MAG: cupin domain-containing protein, partial [Alphaproteobacteria bacterium]|nr:cupin domain-containing protein [Alphaproteobacteria bacterium]